MACFRISALYGLRGLLVITPFVFACGDRSQSGTPVIWPSRPECADGELIGRGKDGTLYCVSFVGAKLEPQNCLTDQVLTIENGSFKCVVKGNGTTDASLVARIMNAQSQLNQISSTVDILAAGGGRGARFLGVSGALTRGRITSGTKLGFAAAKELCVMTYPSAPTAHMCTPYEMYEALATGQLKESVAIPKAWVYMVGWNNPANAAPTPSVQEGDAGMNENCGSYTSPTDTNKWTGTAVAWERIEYFGAANQMGLKFYSGSLMASCPMNFPIACCD